MIHEDRRKNTRVSSDIEPYIFRSGKKAHYSCKVKNISITGACISLESNVSLNLEDLVHLCFGGDPKLEMKSRIVWLSEDTIGLEFLLDTNRDFESISFIINNLAPRLNK